MASGLTQIVEVELPNGEVILAEVQAIGSSDVSFRKRMRLEDTGAAITQMARWMFDSITAELPRPPDKVGIDFGVKLMVKTGKLTSVLAEASAEATATVKLEWTRASGEIRAAVVSAETIDATAG